MENKYLLTIAIPTFNREKELRSCLDAFCPQLTDEVKLVVRDNCSTTYDFDKLIAPYVEKYGVEAYRNNVNIGGDANIAGLFADCETPWLWVCGDDDAVKTDAVSIVVKTIKEHSRCVFIKFRSHFEGETSNLIQLSDVYRKRGEFGNSFFISVGIHNIGLSRDMMQWHYRFLSTKIAQILRVIKYIDLHPEGKCYFTTQDILAEKGVAKWNASEMVEVQLPIFYFFQKERKILSGSIFRDIIRYIFIYNIQSELSPFEKINNCRVYLVKYGLYNFIRYNFGYLLVYFLREKVRRFFR